MASVASRSRVWLITGTSSGLGRDLVHVALARNDKVIATARGLSHIRDLESERCQLLELDVSAAPEVINAKAKEAIALFGQIDIVVNNAGFGVIQTTEEGSYEAYVTQFQTNFFGALNVTNAVLPHMRSRKEGTVVVVGSRSAWRVGMPMMGPYAASKAAVHSMCDVLAVELQPFNIRVLCVQPGGLCTQSWSKAQSLPVDRQIRDYDVLRERQAAWVKDQTNHPPGDALKAANVIADVVRDEGVAKGRPWPGTLVLGDDAERDVRAKCAAMLGHLDEWSDVVRGIKID